MITADEVSDKNVGSNGLLFTNVTVWTPEIDRFGQSVARWIRMGQPGGAVYGQQRNGKTRACSYLVRFLPEVLGYQIAVLHWSIPEQIESKQTEREFIQEMMHQSNCARVMGRDLAVLRRRFLTHLAELALGAGSKRIVVIIDEAQNLFRAQYGYLIHCFNSLENFGVQPFFLLVGQPELQNTPVGWAEASGMQVLGRFFAREHRYRGVDRTEVEAVLDGFDMPTDGEACSDLAKRYPAEYEAGWCLRKLAPFFVEAMDMVMQQHNIQSGLRLPMQYFHSTLLDLLYRVKDENISLLQVSTPMVLTSLKESGFLSVLAYYVDPSSGDSGTHRAVRGMM
ncbi:ATP-binding protein [Rhodoferax ferrireducens]|uniref:ATP-binding protein n=1 Tax=Rhodoferax ferrireducens TaxID=192843 RepID=UPI000E0DB878|nr:ATP-binding protein [Rhodoferax ferrireducens]